MTKTVLLGDVVEIDPKISIPKGHELTFVPMDSLEPYKKSPLYTQKRKFSGGSKFQNGDTLLARITPCLENGKCAYVSTLGNGEKAAGSTEFIVLRGKEGVSDNEFVYYLAISPIFRNFAIQSMVGTSGRQRVQLGQLKNFEFELPELREQKEIAKILGDLDAKIELNRRMNETLEKIGQTLFKHYFIDSPDKTDWKVSSLDQIAHFLNGLAMQKYPGSDLPVIKIRELSNGITTSTDFASSHIPEQFIVHNGDVLFSWSGTLTVKIWTGGKGALNQHLFKVTSNEYPAWFYYFWIKQHLKSFIEVAKGKSTTMGHIQRHHLTYAKVVIPSEKEIERMGELFEPLFNATINNSLQVNTLTELRDSLLPRLVSGKLKV